jgi:hypothetical protein
MTLTIATGTFHRDGHEMKAAVLWDKHTGWECAVTSPPGLDGTSRKVESYATTNAAGALRRFGKLLAEEYDAK